MSPEEGHERTPVGFRILLGAAALYLLVRLAEGVAWIIDRLR